MDYESVSPSAVRSIKQQDFLKVWLRIFEKTRRLPALADFQPSRLEDEKSELMYYDIVRKGADIRYSVTFAGSRLIEAYGFSAVGRDLQDLISPVIWEHVEPLYDQCVSCGMPIYSVFQVVDLRGDVVNFERLLLPFGHDEHVQQMIASIKSISVEGRFVNVNLMRSEDHEPVCLQRAVVDRTVPVIPKAAWFDDVVEI